MNKIDSWLANTLFWPPIVKFCQIAKCTQYQFARWIRAISYTGLTLTNFDYETLDYMFLVAASIFVADAILSSPTRGENGLDVLRWAMIGICVFCVVTLSPLTLLYAIGMLFAEYAFLLKDLPPAESKKFVDTLAYS